MGENLINYYHSHMKKEYKIAFFSALIVCLLTHIYKFTNTLPNHDSLFNVYIDQDMTTSGRWFLQYACGISSFFDLPWVTGILSAFYLSMTCVVITALFEIHNPVVIFLSSALLVTTPSTTETFFYGYTADGYMLGLFLTAYAAYLICHKKKLVHYLIAGIMLCLACAIYQAYVSFTLILCAIWLILQLINGKKSAREVWSWIGSRIIWCALSLLVYYVIWQITLTCKHISAADYQGISTVTQLSLYTVLHGLAEAAANLFLFLIERNFLRYPITPYTLFNLIWIVCFAAIMLRAIVKAGVHKSAAKLFTIFLILIACVPIISLWELTSTTMYYRPMMLHSVCLFYILSILLFDKWVRPAISTLFGILVLCIVFNFSIIANISYLYLEQSYEKSYYIGAQLMQEIEQIISTEASPVSSIAIIGNRHDEVRLTNTYPAAYAQVLTRHLEKDLIYDGTHTYLVLSNIFGLNIPYASASQIENISQNQDIMNLPPWPNQDCMTVEDETLVIILGDTDTISESR